MKILYVGDLHIGTSTPEYEKKTSEKLLKRAEDADLIIFCGDLTDAGRPEQYEYFSHLC